MEQVIKFKLFDQEYQLLHTGALHRCSNVASTRSFCQEITMATPRINPDPGEWLGVSLVASTSAVYSCGHRSGLSSFSWPAGQLSMGRCYKIVNGRAEQLIDFRSGNRFRKTYSNTFYCNGVFGVGEFKSIMTHHNI